MHYLINEITLQAFVWTFRKNYMSGKNVFFSFLPEKVYGEDNKLLYTNIQQDRNLFTAGGILPCISRTFTVKYGTFAGPSRLIFANGRRERK